MLGPFALYGAVCWTGYVNAYLFQSVGYIDVTQMLSEWRIIILFGTEISDFCWNYGFVLGFDWCVLVKQYVQ